MLKVRKSADRGVASFGWLRSQHTFSFGHYYDPAHMNVGPLRVINEDRVAPGRGFDPHSHKNMEIISYVLDGALEHKDNIGTGSVIVPGDVQRMSAGRGVMHSEYNPSRDRPVHFLQIWIEPNVKGIAPSYEQKAISREAKAGRLALIASPDGRDGSVTIHQDARIYAGLLERGDAVTHPLAAGRLTYLHVARGSVDVNGVRLAAGDAARLMDEAAVKLDGGEGAEVLLFDLAA